MKIQDVIDEVNEVWGEEHEEKRKKIFRENILWKPLGVFRDVSLFYLFVTLVFLVFHMFGPPFRRYSKHIFACICIQLSILLF